MINTYKHKGKLYVFFHRNYIQTPNVSSVNLSASTYSVILVLSLTLASGDLLERKIMTPTMSHNDHTQRLCFIFLVHISEDPWVHQYNWHHFFFRHGYECPEPWPSGLCTENINNCFQKITRLPSNMVLPAWSM